MDEHRLGIVTRGVIPGRWPPEPDRARSPDRSGAKRAGVGVQTVRYYERRGLLLAPIWRHFGQRIYASETIDLLRAVKTAQRLGFTLVEIEEILHLSSRKASTSNPHQDRMRDKGLDGEC